ncbi:MAG: hypothetical protein J1F10_06350 [Muribaculaceae bacterium]|nr:hypothetical protein [Muribaculaceae bacterium]
MWKIILIVLIFICNLQNLFAVTHEFDEILKLYHIDRDSINRFDSEGKKKGCWFTKLSNTESYLVMSYYLNGEVCGITRFFKKVDDRYILDSYEIPVRPGSYGMSMDNSYNEVSFIVTCISPNINFKIQQEKVKYYGPNTKQGYLYIYENTGRIISEGWIIFDEDSFIVDSYNVGIWKFYDETGNITYKDYGNNVGQ